MNTCSYSEIFGKPREGVHQYRFFQMALVDILLTILGAFLISRVFKVHFLYTLIGLFATGVVLHHLFCVRTTVDKWIFGE